MMMGLATGLLVFTGFWHMTEWLMGGRNRDTLRLIPFGAIYLVLGYLIAVGQAGLITLIIALVITCIGISAAFMMRNTSQIRRWVTWAFILIDAGIIAGLVTGILAAL